MLRLANKAQAEFNWILILVAGIIILSAMLAFAVDYKRLSDRRINTELSLALSSQLDSFTTSGLSTIINPDGLSFFTTRFTCNNIILNDGEPISLDDKIIFSSSSITSDKLILWVDEFSLPYKIANIYYVSSPYIKYYVLYDSQTQQLAFNLLFLLPKGQDNKPIFNFQPVSYISESEINQDIASQQLREVRIIAFQDIEIPRLTAKAKVIRISPSLESGDAYYLDSNKLEKYVKRQLFLAAIMSDNYKCNLDKLLARLETVNNIYEDKASRLFLKTQSTKPACNYQLFSSSISQLNPKDIDSLPQFEKRILANNLELNKKGCNDVF